MILTKLIFNQPLDNCGLPSFKRGLNDFKPHNCSAANLFIMRGKRALLTIILGILLGILAIALICLFAYVIQNILKETFKNISRNGLLTLDVLICGVMGFTIADMILKDEEENYENFLNEDA